MRIRSITLFHGMEGLSNPEAFAALGRNAAAAREAFEAAGYDVQTTRLATDARSSMIAPNAVADLEAATEAAGFEYLALGPLPAAEADTAISILRRTRRTFLTMQVVGPPAGTIDLSSARAAARVIDAAAEMEDGFGNLRFAALANVPPGTPFFPAAYHGGGPSAFAVATEAADLAVQACSSATSAQEAHRLLRSELEREGARLCGIAHQVTQACGLAFSGIDFSLAPYPAADISIGAALEALSGEPLGGAGTLAAAAVLTDAIDGADFPHTGFCGLMLPVLEDPVLARRAAEGRLGLGELLQWSAVCGTGLDTVPLPGDTSQASLFQILLDVAALAVRLAKPLTARLMPLRGKRAGDAVHFDFAYFADGGVLMLVPAAAGGLLRQGYELALQPHRRIGRSR